MLNIISKFVALLSAEERRKLYMLFFLVLASAFAEVAGVASVLPFLSLVANPESVHDNAILSWAYETFSFPSEDRFLLATGVGVLVILTVSNTLRAVMIWRLMRFAWMRNHSLSRRLLGRYLSRPYVFFLNRNTADLGKNILIEIQQITGQMLVPGLQAVARGVVVLAIFAFLVAVDPLLALIIALVIGGGYGIIYIGVRRLLYRIGEDRFAANHERFQVANEAFGGIKNLKLLGRESVFIDRFTDPSKRFSMAQATNRVIAQVPRYALELLAFGGLLVIVLYLLAIGRGLEQVLPTAGLYAFAGYRLMPSLQQTFRGIAQIRFNAPALESIYEELEGAYNDPPLDGHRVMPPESLPLRATLDLEKITYRYPDTDLPALQNVNLTIEAQTSIAFVGPTGAGKTTLADIILGLLQPESGRMLVDGVEVGDHNRIEWQAGLGYIPQEIFLQDASVTRNIAFAVHPNEIDTTAVQEAARLANIHDFIMGELPRGYETKIGERGVRLSGGQRQRIGIARALYHDPDVLVMDEATSALDSVTEKVVFDAIENIAATKTLIIIAHRLATIQGCDVVHMLDRGRIVASGTYDELLKMYPQFQEMATPT